MDNQEIIKRLKKVQKSLDKMSVSFPQVSMLSYDLWHLIKELQMEGQNEIPKNEN